MDVNEEVNFLRRSELFVKIIFFFFFFFWGGVGRGGVRSGWGGEGGQIRVGVGEGVARFGVGG